MIVFHQRPGVQVRQGDPIVDVIDPFTGRSLSRQEIDETLGVTTYMGGGPSLMYAASAIAAFEEFSRSAAA